MARSFDTIADLEDYIKDVCTSQKMQKAVSGEMKKALHKKAKEISKSHVKMPKRERSKDKSKKTAWEKWHDKYGYSYVRYFPRDAAGGIADIKSIVSEEIVDSIEGALTVSVYDVAKPAPAIFGKWEIPDGATTFSEWINDGLWVDLKEYLRLVREGKRPSKGQAPKRKAIPFVDSAFTEISSDDSSVMETIERVITG